MNSSGVSLLPETPPLARGTDERRLHEDVRAGDTPARAGNGRSGSGAPRACRRHPRSRGERTLARFSVSIFAETPPLARGTEHPEREIPALVGDTPARAGNGRRRVGTPIQCRRHPRSRGERCRATSQSSIAAETPPLARGTDGDDRHGDVRAGDTPARAGNGLEAWFDSLPDAETPPLARGTGHVTVRQARELGDTPARAGNGSRSSAPRTHPRRHPRSRGERSGAADLFAADPETPPLARGTGSTPPRPLRSAWRHPRSRGERAPPAATASPGPETPPLARGTAARASTVTAMIGDTPARAGNGPSRCRRTRPSRRHPRSRGERTPTLLTDPGFLETPPLARGTALAAAVAVDREGDTPARAGNGASRPGGPSPAGRHPRSRGERNGAAGHVMLLEETPPLARGTVHRAGQGPAPGRRHPRSRGERCSPSRRRSFWLETPPLARGTDSPRIDGSHDQGDTPARAGNGRDDP